MTITVNSSERDDSSDQPTATWTQNGQANALAAASLATDAKKGDKRYVEEGDFR
jgi:hypothetical protein